MSEKSVIHTQENPKKSPNSHATIIPTSTSPPHTPSRILPLTPPSNQISPNISPTPRPTQAPLTEKKSYANLPNQILGISPIPPPEKAGWCSTPPPSSPFPPTSTHPPSPCTEKIALISLLSSILPSSWLSQARAHQLSGVSRQVKSRAYEGLIPISARCAVSCRI